MKREPTKAAAWRAYGVRWVSCLLVLVGGARLLAQWPTMSDTETPGVHAAAGLTHHVGEFLAPRPAPAATREWTIAMVLPRPEQNDEIAFRRYLARHHVAARYAQVAFTGRARDRAALVRQVRALRPDLIYAWGTPTTLALAGRYDDPERGPGIRDIPIVFAEVSDPVGAGIVASLDAPGRNVTGVPHIAPLETQLEVLRSYRNFRRIGFIDNPLEVNSALLLARLRTLAHARGIDIVAREVGLRADGAADVATIPARVRELRTAGADVLYIGASTLLAFSQRDLVTTAALAAGLPTFCTTESILRQSRCLYGIFSNGGTVGEFAAFKAERILVDGHAPAAIPARPLARFSTVVNLAVARRLDLYPPLALLQAAEVVGVAASEPVRSAASPSGSASSRRLLDDSVAASAGSSAPPR